MPTFYPIHPLVQPLSSSESNQQAMDDYYDGSYGRDDSYKTSDAYGSYNSPIPQQMPMDLEDPFVDHQQSQPALPSSIFNYGNGFYPMGAPVMAPLPIDQRYFDYANRQQTATYSEPQASQEKPRGGIAATLDYDMDQMTNFVTEMSVGMYDLYVSRICATDIDLFRSIKPGVNVSTKYREWTRAMLTATRLPSATILMSLSYFALRICCLPGPQSFSLPSNGLHQMLTVALILGSKFLDDNTFQNNSWAEVSHIPVKEINKEERDWLAHFEHRLHFDPSEPNGYNAWHHHWSSYKARTTSATSALRPIDTNVRRQRSMNALSAMKFQSNFNRAPTSNRSVPQSHAGNTYTPQSYSPYNPWFNGTSGYENSPPTATPSGPNTPNYYDGRGIPFAAVDVYHHHGYPTYSMMASQSTAYHSGYPTPPYNYWNCHGSACQCQSCRNVQNLLPNRFNQVAVGGY